MKVIAVNGSPKKDGNTSIVLQSMSEELAKQSIDTEKMRQANGILLGVPVYFGGITGRMKLFLDRLFYTSFSYFKNKVRVAFVTIRRTGGADTYHQLCSYLTLAVLVIPPTRYWGIAYESFTRFRGYANNAAEGNQYGIVIKSHGGRYRYSFTESKAFRSYQLHKTIFMNSVNGK